MERCRENSSTVNRMESHMAGASGVWQQKAEGQVSLERKTRTLGAKLTRRAASCRQREGSHLSLQDLGMLQSICSRDVDRWAAERVSSLPCGRTEPGKVRGCAWSYAQAGDPAFERVMSSL